MNQHEQDVHKTVMRAVINAIGERELMLKGGTALMFGYGSLRFSDDLDFDGNEKIRDIEKKIANIKIANADILKVDTLKDTSTASRYRVRYRSEISEESLIVEISYRAGFLDKDTNVVDGFRVATLERLIDNKLSAAHDGKNPRTKSRDLYDLHFLAHTYEHEFDNGLAQRLGEFAADPGLLAERYIEAFREDDVLSISEQQVEEMALQLHFKSLDILNRIQRENRGLGAEAKHLYAPRDFVLLELGEKLADRVTENDLPKFAAAIARIHELDTTKKPWSTIVGGGIEPIKRTLREPSLRGQRLRMALDWSHLVSQSEIEKATTKHMPTRKPPGKARER